MYERKGENMEEYDVIFLDDDKKTVLANIKVEYGDTAVFPGKNPTKEPVAGVKYTFVGWVGEEKLAVVTDNVVVYASTLFDHINNVMHAIKNFNIIFFILTPFT